MPTNNSVNNKSQELTVDPLPSGDAFVQFDINGNGEFRIGIEDGVSELFNLSHGASFKISQGSSLGTNDTLVITPDGERTMPLQPAFLTTQEADQIDVTGAGTDYIVTFLDEVFDQNSDFDGTSTFTAPIIGRYYLNCSVFLQDVAMRRNVLLLIVTSNATYKNFQLSFVEPQLGIANLSGFALADMDESDTAEVHTIVSGGAEIVDVLGSISAGCRSPFFSGWLVC